MTEGDSGHSPGQSSDSSETQEFENSENATAVLEAGDLPTQIDEDKFETSDLGVDENPLNLQEAIVSSPSTEYDPSIPNAVEEPPIPVRGLDIFHTTRLSFDIASYGGRHYFEYAVDDAVKSSSWIVPAGTSEGEEFRFLAKGQPGSFGGESGDLVISVEVDESTRSRDFIHEISIPWDNSLHQHLGKITLSRGDEQEVVKFTIPANIKSGQYVRVRGAGFVDKEDAPAGDLIVNVTVQDPLPTEDLHAYAVINFWAAVKIFFRLTPTVKIYRVSNNNFVKSFRKLKKKHTPEISWTFPGDGEVGKGSYPNSDLYLTPHFTGKAYMAPAISSLAMIFLFSLSIIGQQTLTWTGDDAFYAKYLSEPKQSGPSSSTRNENITFEISKPTWAPDGFQLIESDPNVAVRMPDPSTYDCSAAKTLNCLNVEVYTKIKCDVLTASVVFYSEDLKVNESTDLKLNKFRDLSITTIKFFPRSKKPFPKWDFLSITCSPSK